MTREEIRDHYLNQSKKIIYKEISNWLVNLFENDEVLVKAIEKNDEEMHEHIKLVYEGLININYRTAELALNPEKIRPSERVKSSKQGRHY